MFLSPHLSPKPPEKHRKVDSSCKNYHWDRIPGMSDILTHWAWDICIKFYRSYIQANFNKWWLRYLLQNCPHVTGPTDDKSTLVQLMVWCHQATSHHLSQHLPSSMSPYGIIWATMSYDVWRISYVTFTSVVYALSKTNDENIHIKMCNETSFRYLKCGILFYWWILGVTVSCIVSREVSCWIRWEKPAICTCWRTMVQSLPLLYGS